MGIKSSDSDESQHSQKKKKKKKFSTKSQPSQPSNIHGKKYAYLDPEIEQMMKKIDEMDYSLQEKMDKLCEQSGMTKNELDDYIGNPNNFSSDQWQKASQNSEQWEKKIYSKLGVKMKKEMMVKKSQKSTKQFKGKTLGSRKGWLKM